MSSTLALILVVAAAYLAAHVAFDWLARRLLIVSGAEYLLLGILLGPQVGGMFTAEFVTSLAPIMLLALGWTGAIIGFQFHLPALVRLPGITYRLAFVESLLTFLVVGALQLVALTWLFDLSLLQAATPAVALGAIATASASAGIQVVARRMRRSAPVLTQLAVSTAINAFTAVAAFGLLLSVRHSEVLVLGRPLTATEWAVITVAIGVVGGALFHLFLESERQVDRLFISLAGGIILVSGAAAYLRLSPLLTAMFFGIILVNTSRNREEIAGALERVERPFYFVLLVFAGATWRPSLDAWWVLPVLLFLAARTVGKIGGARLATRLSGMRPVLGDHWGRALLGQGGLAVAIGLNYLFLEGAALQDIVFTAAIASVLLTDLLSARLAKSVVESVVDPQAGTERTGTTPTRITPVRTTPTGTTPTDATATDATATDGAPAPRASADGGH